MFKFKFLRGFISARIVNIEERLTLAQPRYPRIPMGQIPYPEIVKHQEKKEYSEEDGELVKEVWRYMIIHIVIGKN